jgi:hypothetical protein
MLIAAKNMLETNKLKSELGDEIEMKELGTVKKILGMKIYRDRKGEKLFLLQKVH